MANENENHVPDDESPDGLTAEERAQFAEMERAGAGDDAAGAAAAEDQGDGDAAAAGANADQGDGDGAAKAGDRAGAGDAGAGDQGAKPGAKAAAAADADTGEDDGEDDDEPEAGAADGKVGADGQPARRKKGRVSAKKYQDAEARATAAEAKANEAQQTIARFDERMKILNEALTTPKKQAAAEDDDPKPDKEADAFAYMEWLERQNVKTAKRLDEIQSGTAAKQQNDDVASIYERDARQFATQEPNFGFAYNHLMGVRVRQLALFNFGVDLTEQGAQLTPQQIAAIERDVAAEEQGIIQTALRNKQSPAQAVYRMAKATGYVPKTREEIAAWVAERNGGAAAVDGAGKPANNGAKPGANGAKPAANGNGAAKVDVAAEIKKIKEGSESSLSLSNGGGASPPPLTPQRIANMSEEEFAELADNISPEEWQMLVEGRA